MSRLSGIVPDLVAESYLRKFLTITVAIAAVSAATFGGFLLYAEQQQRDGLREELPTVAGEYATGLATEIDEKRALAVSLSRTDAVRTGDTTAVSQQLSELAAQRGETIHRVAYVNRDDGTVLAAVGNDTTADAPWTGGVSFDDPDATTVTDGFELGTERYVAVVSPVAGTNDRAVAVTIPVEEQLSFEAGLFVESLLVVDSDQTVVADTRAGDGGDTTAENRVAGFDDADAAADDGETGLLRDGATWVGYTRVPDTELTLLAVNPGGTQVLSGSGAAVLVGILFAPSLGLLVVGLTFIRRTSNAISDLQDRAEALADGDFEVSFETDRRDEVGDLGRSFDTMQDSLSASLTRAQEAQEEAESRATEIETFSDHVTRKAEAYEATMAAVADGDLTARVDPDSEEPAIQSLGQQFNAVLAELETTIAEVDAFATEVATASDRVAASAAEVATASDRVTTVTTDVSEAAADQQERLVSVEREMEELSATVEEVASTSGEVSETAATTTEVAREGATAAEEAVDALDSVETTTTEAVEAFESLRRRTDEVSEIVELIADIAEQTNMLALNANIEAARADIDGDGFAVVADEVKQLATQAQTHADEIDEIVAGIDADTEATAHRLRDAETAVRDSADTVAEAQEALETVVEQTETTEQGMAEIDQATDDQAASAEQVSSMVAAVAETAGDTDDLTRDAGEAAREQNDAITGVTETAESLSERAARLDELLSTFDLSESDEATAEAPADRRGRATDD
jgi:methyl-accepting chemotaxis protein